ncbi:MAG: threonine/serine dehydratase [Woeseiaceae bacterium]
MSVNGPHIDTVRELRDLLGADIARTPVVRCAGIEDALADGTTVHGKLEFLQRTGTFKARGALAVLTSLSREQRAAGVTAFSAGNHAIATAFAAGVTGANAKVVMIATANPLRVAACEAFGAEVVMADDAHVAFEVAEDIQKSEGRFFVHPFEGPEIAAGTGTVGLELCEQCDEFDVLIVPVGGGGLIAGIANVDCEIIGIEPEGAKSMHLSFASGRPEPIDKVRTIADSLGAPFALPYSFELCRQNVDSLALVDDDMLRRAMGFLYSHMQIAVEPACAATTAALLGPLREKLSGRRVALTFCGSNIDWATWRSQAILE